MPLSRTRANCSPAPANQEIIDKGTPILLSSPTPVTACKQEGTPPADGTDRKA